MRSLSWSGAGRWFVTGLKWLGWLLLAVVVGSLVVARTSSGGWGLALGAGGTVVAAALGPRLADRWPALQGRLMWASLILAGLAVLIASARNTPFGEGTPVHWMSVVLGSAGLILATIGLWRHRRARGWLTIVVTAALLGAVAFDGFAALSRHAVEIDNGAVHLSGTLYLPRGEGPFPLVVFAHGAGPQSRIASRPFADRLAREGIAALTWDKRGSGASRGGWPGDSYEELASDIAAWVTAMRDRDDIAGDRVAIWGLSEGGWTGPLAAIQLGDIAALLLIAPGAKFEDALVFQQAGDMRAAGSAEDDVERAIDLRRRINQHYRDGEGRSELLAELHSISQEDWYRAAIDSGLLITPDRLMEPGSPEAEQWIGLTDFSSLDALSQFSGPVFAAFALDDRCMPARQAADQIERVLQQGGNDYRIVRYRGAGHPILMWLSLPEACTDDGVPPDWYPAGFVDEVATWLVGVLQPSQSTR